jgi:hypothetical protein
VLLIPAASFGAQSPAATATNDNMERIHYSPFPDRDDADDDIVYEYGFEDGWNSWTTQDLTDVDAMWHVSEEHAFEEGSSWWCADENLGGYDNHWLQYLNTPVLDLTNHENLTLNFMLYYYCEDPEVAAPPPDSTGYDGWDGCNVWISIDGGESFEVITPTAPEYDYASLYSFGEEWGMGLDIPGWAGFRGEWLEAEFDLSDYAGQEVIVRWAFCSDPGWATGDIDDDDRLAIGMLVDEMQIIDGDQVLWENDGTQVNQMTVQSMGDAVGDLWEISNAEANTGDFSAHCPIEMGVMNGLTTPPLEIPEEGFYTYFDFWLICNTRVSDSDGDGSLDDLFRIKVSDDDGLTWEDMIYDYGDPDDRPDWFDDWGHYGPDSWFRQDMPEWKRKLNLTQFAGQTIYLRWIFVTDSVLDGDQGTGLWIDDFTLWTTSRSENDAGISYANIGYPIGMGLTTDCQIIVKNYGMATQNNIRKYFQINNGRATPITPWQGDLEADSSLTYNFRVQNLDFAGPARISTWTALNEDENAENDTARFDVTVFPEGIYKLGYDSRLGQDEIGFVVNNGPAVLYTPTNDGVDGNFDLLAVDVTWGAEVQDHDTTTTLSIYSDRRGAPSDLLYSREISVTMNDLYPNKQHISLEDVDELKDLSTDFWVYFNISAESQIPKPFGKRLTGNDPNPGAGHYYVSNGQQVEEREFEFLVQAYVIKTELNLAPVVPQSPLIDFDLIDEADGTATQRFSILGTSAEDVTITNAEADNNLFSIESVDGLPVVLAFEDFAYFDVTFSPQGQVGVWHANLTFTLEEGNPVVVRLRGRTEESGVSDNADVIPLNFALGDAYPNPFNSTTVIPFAMPQAADVNLSLYDLEGRMVADLISGRMSAGNHSVVLEAGNLTAGIYICRLETSDFSAVRKVVLVK